MNHYHDAWLTLHQQRDMLYLVVFAAVAALFFWYRVLALRRVFRLALAGAALPVAAGLAWGFYQLGG